MPLLHTGIRLPAQQAVDVYRHACAERGRAPGHGLQRVGPITESERLVCPTLGADGSYARPPFREVPYGSQGYRVPKRPGCP